MGVTATPLSRNVKAAKRLLTDPPAIIASFFRTLPSNGESETAAWPPTQRSQTRRKTGKSIPLRPRSGRPTKTAGPAPTSLSPIFYVKKSACPLLGTGKTLLLCTRPVPRAVQETDSSCCAGDGMASPPLRGDRACPALDTGKGERVWRLNEMPRAGTCRDFTFPRATMKGRRFQGTLTGISE